MSILFITIQGSSVKKLSERIIVTKDGLELSEIPVRKTSGVIIFGHVQVSTQVLAYEFAQVGQCHLLLVVVQIVVLVH